MLNEYQLNRQDFHKIWAAFQQIDKQNDGYITVNQLMSFLSEREYSICSPYIHRFFLLIDKDVEERVTFQELLKGLILYNLFTRQELIAFVFNMLDEDRDGFVAKIDIFRFLLQYRYGYRVFPVNVTRSVEICAVKRGDKIDFMEFAELTRHTQFILFPAFRIQADMQELFGGLKLWRRVKNQLEKRQNDQKVVEEREKFAKRAELLTNQDKQVKRNFYMKKKGEWLQKYEDKQNALRDRTRPLRVHKRRASDGMLGVNMDAVFVERIMPHAEHIRAKQVLQRDNPDVDVPILGRKLHYSFVWDKYTLSTPDPVF